ncbi:MAG TPA: tRNA pseudouridine(55) synthase TruB [Gemmatimonadaceae bacterium]|nr:tRNA pseudouridine(55) synthase TruB [Gemmatimonadaceae bacterium]
MGSRPTEGLLLVDKPAGMTSHDVVGVARRMLGERRIGHAGTLDPFATGLLVLLVGRVTRLLPYLEGEPKVYDATIRFGTETDTDDRTGAPVRAAEVPAEVDVRAAIDGLTGELTQVPPRFSAKQSGGQRAYHAARRGETLEVSPVSVIVHGWAILGWRGSELDASITCSGGTYIRALARDLGRACGSAAHLAELRRTRSGPFHVGDAASIDALLAGAAALRPPLVGAPSLPVQQLGPAELAAVTRGNTVPATVGGSRAALTDAEGSLVAIAERHGDEWRPKVVLRDP